MGLDILYASRVDFESRREPDTENYRDDIVFLFANDIIFNQSDGISNGEYLYEPGGSFRAGSYSGYSRWRKMLACMIGWEIEELWGKVGTLIHRNENINNVLDENGEADINIPFVELLNFSDCEGFIGPKTSAKLHADFLEWHDKAKSFKDGGEYFYDLYQKWMKAFEVASDGGCVVLG
jgi:hypothetical protein